MEQKPLFTLHKDAHGEYTIRHYFTLEEFLARVKNIALKRRRFCTKITRRVKNDSTFR